MGNELKTTFVIDEGNSPQRVHSFKKSLNDLNSQINELGKDSKFGQKITADFDKLQTKAKETQKSFQTIQTTRLDAGNVNHLTREIVCASERSRQLAVDIGSIKKELADPNRKSSIKFLTEELRAAGREADQLNRKLSALPSQSGGGLSGKSSGKQGGARRGRITDFQATALELTDDFVPEGFNRPFNAAARGLLSVNALSVATLGTFGAIAAVGFGIVKVTENIREVAEKRLKVEESIVGAINRQILAQKESLQNLQKMRDEAQKGREFDRSLASSSIDDLTRRRSNIEQLKNLIPATLPTLENGKVVSKPNENFEKISSQLLALDAQIDALQQKNQKAANDSFYGRSESFKKSQESAIKAQEKAKEAQDKLNKSIEDGKQKVKELGKTYTDTFDNLFQKSKSDNPFVSVFSEGEKALKSLRENLKGLDADLQSKAFAMQQKINSNALFSTKLDNNLATFDLRETARNFRNPQESAEQGRKRIDDVVQASIKAGGYFQGIGGSYGSFLANQAGGFDKLTDNQKRDIYETRSFGSITAVNPSGSAFNDLNQNSLLTSLANDRVKAAGGENGSLNDRLKKQLDIIYGGASSAEEKAIADRKLISLSSGLNPSEINSQLREKIAFANENEAVRRTNYENESLQVQKDLLKVQSQLAENGKKLLAIAEKEGSSGVKQAIEVTVKTNDPNVKSSTGSSATNSDVSNYYRIGDVHEAGNLYGSTLINR